MEHLVSVAIVGAGYAGLQAAITLKKEFQGRIELVIYEKASAIGGTWRDNVYPGAAADSAIHLYSLSTHPNPRWSATHASQPEILAYMTDVVEQAGLAPHIQFDHNVISARWDPSTSRYTLEIEDTTIGEKLTSHCHVLISATGNLRVPDMSSIPGIENFTGKLMHTSQWNPEVDLRNKKVAVIGNGASGCQILPAIAEIEGVEVSQFFRTPNWMVPSGSRLISSKVQDRYEKYPTLMKAHRCTLFWMHELVYLIVFGSGFLRTLTEKFSRKYIRKNAPEEYHAALLPDYPMGCQRIVFDTLYLQSLHRQNVTLVNQPVRRFTETGLITGDGQYRHFDIIVAATGYISCLPPFEIHGHKSLTLQEYYNRHGGPEAYKGTMVPGFPNFFMLGDGPNVSTGYMSYLFIIYCQLNLVTPLVLRLMSSEVASYEVTQRAAYAYNQTLRKRFRNTVWSTMSARHFKDPTSGKIIFLFPGSTLLFWWWTRSLRWSDFLIDGKEVKRARVPCSLMAFFAVLFLVITLVVVLVSVDKARNT